MLDINKKTILHLLGIIFLLAGIFGCILSTQGLFMSDQNHSVEHNCCDDSGIFGSMTHNTPIILQSDMLLKFLVLFFVTAYIFVQRTYLDNWINLSGYVKTRGRYGGFNLFYYFINLFSRGILHPKIY